jgi:Uma2 family endonuclease
MARLEPPPNPVDCPDQLVRLNVDDYLRLTASGVLPEGSPIELLDGLLVWKDRRDQTGTILNVGVRHRRCVVRLVRMLDRLGEAHGCHAVSQKPMRVSDEDLPDPDVLLLRGNESGYDEHHPLPEDAVLVVEVADSSLKQDREIKLRKYAVAGVSIYWIANLVDDQIEVYTQPNSAAGRYDSRVDYRRGDQCPLVYPDGEVLLLDVEQALGVT